MVEAGVICAAQHARIDDYSGKDCPKNGTRVPKMNLLDPHPYVGVMSEKLTPSTIAALKVMEEDLARWYYTRELSRIAKVGRTTISREFTKIAKQGIVLQKQGGQEKFYKLNIRNETARKLAEVFESERREHVYKRNRAVAYALQDLTNAVFESAPQIQSIIMFGSAARGTATERSDIDLLVLVPNQPQDELNKITREVEELVKSVTGRHPVRIAPVVMTLHDFEQGLKDRRRFGTDVLRDGLVIFGVERYFLLLSRVLQ